MLAYAHSNTRLAILGVFSVCVNELNEKVTSTLVTLADDKGRVKQKSRKTSYLKKSDMLENINEIILENTRYNV